MVWCDFSFQIISRVTCSPACWCAAASSPISSLLRAVYATSPGPGVSHVGVLGKMKSDEAPTGSYACYRFTGGTGLVSKDRASVFHAYTMTPLPEPKGTCDVQWWRGFEWRARICKQLWSTIFSWRICLNDNFSFRSTIFSFIFMEKCSKFLKSEKCASLVYGKGVQNTMACLICPDKFYKIYISSWKKVLLAKAYLNSTQVDGHASRAPGAHDLYWRMAMESESFTSVHIYLDLTMS